MSRRKEEGHTRVRTSMDHGKGDLFRQARPASSLWAVAQVAILVGVAAGCRPGPTDHENGPGPTADRLHLDVWGRAQVQFAGTTWSELWTVILGLENSTLATQEQFRSLRALLSSVKGSASGDRLELLFLDPQVHGGSWALHWFGDADEFVRSVGAGGDVVVDGEELVLGVQPARSLLENFQRRFGPQGPESPDSLAGRTAALPPIFQQIGTVRRTLIREPDGSLLLVPRREGLRNIRETLRAVAIEPVSDASLSFALGRFVARVREDWEEALQLPLLALSMHGNGRSYGRFEYRVRTLAGCVLDLLESIENIEITRRDGGIELRCVPEQDSFSADLFSVLREEETTRALADIPPAMGAFSLNIDPARWAATYRRWLEPDYRRLNVRAADAGLGWDRAWAALGVGSTSFLELSFHDPEGSARGRKPWRDTVVGWIQSDPLGVWSLFFPDARSRDSLLHTERQSNGEEMPEEIDQVGTPRFFSAWKTVAVTFDDRSVLVASDRAEERAVAWTRRTPDPRRKSLWSQLPNLPERAALLVISSLPFLAGRVVATVEEGALVVFVHGPGR